VTGVTGKGHATARSMMVFAFVFAVIDVRDTFSISAVCFCDKEGVEI
jgi:hypothetical protein